MRRIVLSPASQAVEDASYAVALPLVMSAAHVKYPAKDMAVLKKYDCAREDHCIRIAAESLVTQFDIKLDDAGVLRPQYHGCRPIPCDDVTRQAVETWRTAVTINKEALDQKRRDYRGLIRAARTFEEIVEVWPEAEELRQSICQGSTAMTVFSPELVERIRQDVAERAVAA